MKLSFKISLLVSVISIFFMLLVFSNTQHRIIHESEQHILIDYQNSVEELKSSFDLILQKATYTVSHLSFMRQDVLKKNIQILKTKYEMTMRDVPHINKITLISLTGKEIIKVSKNKLFDKADPSKSYINDTEFQTTLKNGIYYSDIYFDQKNHEMMIQLFKIVKNPKTQQKFAVLCVEISLEQLKDIISNKLINGNGIAILNLHNNEFIYKSSQIGMLDEQYYLNDNPKTIQFITQKNTEYIVISKDYSYENLKMRLILVNSTDNIFSHIINTFNFNLILVLISISILAIIIFIFVKSSFRPLTNLIKEIQKKSTTLNKQSTIELNDSNLDEISSIQQHFDFFAKLIENKQQKLQHYNDTLQLRIEEEVKKNQEKEHKLSQQAKLISMGEMLGNIAHQWRQPLSVISTLAGGVSLKYQIGKLEEGEIIKKMDSIMEQSEYLSKAINDFRNFIKIEEDITKEFSIVEMLQKVISLVASTLESSYIELHTDFNEDMLINGYENEFIQAFINIINNAKDAINEHITEDQARLIFIKTQLVDQGIKITILDNGGGIKEENLERVFEPYFTTKHQTVGTGIGLSMVDQIICKRNKGKIELSNKEFDHNNEHFKGLLFQVRFEKNHIFNNE